MTPVCLFLLFAVTPEIVDRQVDPARQVVIVVNEAAPGSVEIGDHYARRRGIPTTQVCRLSTSTGEVVPWPECREKILQPLREFLKSRPNALYVVPVYGVPVKTSEEKPENDGKGEDPYTQCVVGRDFACIDREIELLNQEHDLEGWIASPQFSVDRHLTPEDRVYIVSRLDGPTPESVHALIENAIYGETYGIEGTCLLDTRGLKEGGHASIDIEMRGIEEVYRRYEFTFRHDQEAAVVRLGTIPNLAHYWGWYTGDVIADPAFRFNRGAVGSHLHSFAAAVLRSADRTWTGPLVAHGITGTCGTVYEPLSDGFPFGTIFLDRFFKGYTFGEAMQMSNKFTSWMAVFVGDPLYAPYAKGMKDRQTANRLLAMEAAKNLEGLLDAGDLEAARKTGQELEALPIAYDGAADVGWLAREIRARGLSKKAATGTVAALRAAIGEAGGAPAPDKALAAARKGLVLSEMNFECNLIAGRVLAGQGKSKEAAEALRRATAVEPSHAEAQRVLGAAYLALKQDVEALKAYEAAEAAGDSGSARALGEILLRLKKYAEAEQRLVEALARHPEDRGLLLLRVQCLAALKRQAEAVPALEAAVRRAPADPADAAPYAACWQRLLDALQSAGKRDAIDPCRKVVNSLAARSKSSLSGARAEAVNREIEEGRKRQGAGELGAPLALDPPAPGLPVLHLANRSMFDLEIQVSGPLVWSGKLTHLKGQTKPEVLTLPLYPGKYRILVTARRDKVMTTLFREAEFTLDREYGLGLDAELKVYRVGGP
ncbi:MAG: TIGR03790 family protein [Planctomycetes bacterium]|nr:TIGR03790 family protein [Planctomycetota bacterium]